MRKELKNDYDGEIMESNREVSMFNTPRLPVEIYDSLPYILKESADLFMDAAEKDVFLIGALTGRSGCLPNIRGIYFDEPHSPHLYAFITAPAGSGKGKMKWARYFGQTLHDHMVEKSRAEYEDYTRKIEYYNNLPPKDRLQEEKPLEPLQKMFFIPANSSSSAIIHALADNDFTGVIFETEADTLANTFKQDWGNFSDVLRKAYHHESTSLFRRKEREFIDIKEPHLAVALSGTPRQIYNMMPDTENGLFSRFLYYAFEDDSEFKNPFVSHQQIDYIQFFEEKGRQVFEYYRRLKRLRRPVNFSLAPDHAEHFTSQFDLMLRRNKLLLGNDFEANIKRLGLIAFRIAMILSSLRRINDDKIGDPFICNDTDFRTALTLTTTLEKHAVAVFQNFPGKKLDGIKQKFYDALPEKFNRQIYLKTAGELGIKEKAAEKYIEQFRKDLLEHEYNQYKKKREQ